jgi:hypothetical protein
MRVLIEVLHIAIGLAAAVLIAALASWAYRLGERDFWLVAYVAMVAIVVMGVKPIVRAFHEDRAGLAASDKDRADG